MKKAAAVLLLCSACACFARGKSDGKNTKSAENAQFVQSAQDFQSAQNTVHVVCGNTVFIKNPVDFVPNMWRSGFTALDGTFLKNVGFYKIKRELQVGEDDKGRTEGIASAEHLVELSSGTDGVYVNAKEKGIVTIAASDEKGNTKTWKLIIHAVDKKVLPKANKKQYHKLREKWKTQLTGGALDMNDDVAVQAVKKVDEQAFAVWNSYAYKGKNSCQTPPWPEDIGLKGNPDIKYEDDAVEFRSAFQKLYTLAVAYESRYGEYYKNKNLFSDMIAILDYLTTFCYTPKSQTDNWWTWEIGIPKSLVPTLILLADDLSSEQKQRYITPVVFFQSDPFHGGAIGTASTHGKGYRMQFAANRVDCSVSALGIGLLLEDNESVYLAQQASASTIALQTIEDSLVLSEKGFPSGYYEDGSYLDHSRTPYTNSYGVVVIEGLSKIASILNKSPWQYDKEKSAILKTMMIESYGLSVYNGYALDMLRGRAVARKQVTDKSIGRDITTYVLLLMDALDSETQKTMKRYIKNWLIHDPEYINSLTEITQLAVRSEAKRLLNDTSVNTALQPVHRNFPLMDRVIHRSENWLFGLSMYSSRIFNCEIMNGENLYGWHQGDGMTFLYTGQPLYYTEGYWNTINPFRLPGTTTVSKNIGNGTPDSSGFYQEGDYSSKEDWTGGSALYNFGTNGMLLSGDINEQSVVYEPNLRAHKSYFMTGDEIVCLGAGISDLNSTFKVETTALNRKLKADGSNAVVFNGSKLDLNMLALDTAEIVKTEGKGSGSASMEGQRLEFSNDANWLWLEGNDSASDIGVYFPNAQKEALYARKAAYTGSWSNIGYKQTEEKETTNFFELWFDHGINPVSQSYAYVILPCANETKVKTYAQKPDIAIIANTAQVQAVRNVRTKVSGFNFWTDTETQADFLVSLHKASVTLKEGEGGIIELAVSDPTMKNTDYIELKLQKKTAAVLEHGDNVKAEIKGDVLVIRIYTAGTNGASSYIKIKTAE